MAQTKVFKKISIKKKEDKPFAFHCGTGFIKRIYMNAHIRKFYRTQVDKTSMIQKSENQVVLKVQSNRIGTYQTLQTGQIQILNYWTQCVIHRGEVTRWEVIMRMTQMEK